MTPQLEQSISTAAAGDHSRQRSRDWLSVAMGTELKPSLPVPLHMRTYRLGHTNECVATNRQPLLPPTELLAGRHAWCRHDQAMGSTAYDWRLWTWLHLSACSCSAPSCQRQRRLQQHTERMSILAVVRVLLGVPTIQEQATGPNDVCCG